MVGTFEVITLRTHGIGGYTAKANPRPYRMHSIASNWQIISDRGQFGCIENAWEYTGAHGKDKECPPKSITNAW